MSEERSAKRQKRSQRQHDSDDDEDEDEDLEERVAPDSKRGGSVTLLNSNSVLEKNSNRL